MSLIYTFQNKNRYIYIKYFNTSNNIFISKQIIIINNVIIILKNYFHHKQQSFLHLFFNIKVTTYNIYTSEQIVHISII